MEPLAEVDFEPQIRARSNTWPLPRPENFVEPSDETGNKCSATMGMEGINSGNGNGSSLPVPSAVTTATAKKNSSRRNAWGNLSYADLITQAITSAPEKRLTLSQIYEWMVQNVPYFKDKGDSNSSAGWKVIVHSLYIFIHSVYVYVYIYTMTAAAVAETNLVDCHVLCPPTSYS